MTSLSTSPWTTWSIWYSRRSSSCSAQRRGHRQPCHSCRCDHHSIVFWKIWNFSTKIPLSNKISRSIKRKTVSEHHSVPIVPLTSATTHPHGFSYGFAMFSQMITLLLLSFLCIFPSFEGFQLPFRWQWKCDLSASFLNSQQIRPAQSNSTEPHLLIVVDRFRFATHHLGKREAGIIGYHGGFLGGESESSWTSSINPAQTQISSKTHPQGTLATTVWLVWSLLPASTWTTSPCLVPIQAFSTMATLDNLDDQQM